MIPPLIVYALTLAGRFKYPLFFLGAIMEGPLLMVASGILIRLGAVPFAPVFIALVAGDLVGDIFWYAIGYFFLEAFLRRHGHFLSVTPERFEKAKELFHRYHTNLLLISKVTLGFGMAIGTLMTAGATRIPLRTYMLLNAIGELVLVAVLVMTGVFFGHMYAMIAAGLRVTFLIGVAVVSLSAVLGFSRYARSKIAAI